ncbi:MAG TPA: RsmB/NOP family class I SAM-dependent RNA methyltransferase [Bacteroidota bacterium]|jgi:16S rRNA (cytosine967-C5)-methyltransferase
MNVNSLVGHILELTELTDKSSEPADQVASKFFRQKSYLGAGDRRFISEGFFGIIRHRRLIEALLEEYVRQKPQESSLDAPHVRYLSLYVAYSLLDPVRGTTTAEPDPGQSFPHRIDALWNSFFPESDLASYILWLREHRRLDFLPESGPGGELLRLAVEYSFQDWMVREWDLQFGGDLEKLLRSLNTPAKLTLRVNGLKVGREECRKRLAGEGIDTEPTAFSPAGLVASKRFNSQASAAFKDGWYEVQDEGSQLISLIAEPQPGSMILDACAGAGGKALHLADLMKGKGTIFAADAGRSRIDELDQRARRAGAKNIQAVTEGHSLPDVFRADLVLVDAPCTGAGTIRRNPWIKWRVTEDSVAKYAEKQRNLLHANSRFVKEGGVMMYVTCSLLRGENEEVVGSFLAAHSGFQVERIEPRACPPSMITPEGFVKMLPHDAGTDGFFAAKLVRTP